jgi:NAD(P)-dependent dehydrogenase (short-subunit alcohol dehydrogenase family)
MSKWTTSGIPDQTGRVAVVTGSNTGLGYETAAALAAKGAHVVLAVRNLDKGRSAADLITTRTPGASVAVQELDLTSLESVRNAAEQLRSQHDSIDLLLDRVLAAPGSRVVTVSSIGHRRGQIRFDDLQSERSYSRMGAYGQSKLANLLFTYELQRRLRGTHTIAVAAHPGSSSSELARNVPALVRLIFTPLELQGADMGALPTLRAATDPSVLGGQYYGPDGVLEMRGHPKVVASNDRSHDIGVQRRLWAVSEELTSVTYPVLAMA